MIFALQCLLWAIGSVLVAGLLVALGERLDWPEWAGAVLALLVLALAFGLAQ